VVFVRKLDLPGLHWRVAVSVPAPIRMDVKRSQFAQSAALIVAVLVVAATSCAFVPRVRSGCCRPAARSKEPPRPPASSVEMKNMAFQEKQQRQRKSMHAGLATGKKKMDVVEFFADTDSEGEDGARTRARKNPHKATRREAITSMLFSGDCVTALSVLVLMMSYTVWNFGGMAEFDDPIRALAITVNDRFEGEIFQVRRSCPLWLSPPILTQAYPNRVTRVLRRPWHPIT